MTAPATLRSSYRLQMGSPDAQAVSLAMFPQQSVIALLLLQASPCHQDDGPTWLPTRD
jgi:hypothetical protein